MIHKIESKLGIRCLYICELTKTNREFGFWVNDLPQIGEIRIPNKWPKYQLEWFNDIFKNYLPELPIVSTEHRGGSGDPYIFITYETIKSLPDWKKLIDENYNWAK